MTQSSDFRQQSSQSGSAEDLEVVIAQSTPTANDIASGSVEIPFLPNGLMWQEVIDAGYHRLRFEVEVQNGTDWYSVGTVYVNPDHLESSYELWLTTSDSSGNWSVNPRIGSAPLNLTGSIRWQGDPNWEGARMTLVGIKSQKTIIQNTQLTVTNPNESDTNKVLRPNGDGTATFVAASSGAPTDLATGQWVQNGNNVPVASASWAQVTGTDLRGITATQLTGDFTEFRIDEAGTYDVSSSMWCMPLADGVLTTVKITKLFGTLGTQIVASETFNAVGTNWQTPVNAVGIEITMEVGDRFRVDYTNVNVLDGGSEVTRIRRVR